MVNYLIFLILTSGGTMQNIKYPETGIVNVVDTLFGITIPDPYRWLENFNDPQVKKWVEAQNALTRSILDSLPERKKLEAELEKILTKVSLSSPFVRGNKYFFYRRTGRENHAVLYMSEGKFDPNNARVIIDPNKFSKDGTVAMDWLYPSLDGRYLAYGKSKSGSENSTLYILDVETRKHLKDTIPDTKWTSLAWLPDNSGFYYARNTGGDKFLPRIYFHKLGTPWEEDEYIYGEELGPTEIPAIKVSRDGKYLFLSISRGWTQNDLYFRRIGVDKDWKPIAVGLDGTFRVKVYRDTLYILTNYKAPRHRLLKMAVDNPDIEKADEIIPEGEGVLQSFSFARGKLLYTVKENTYTRFFIARRDGKTEYEVKTPVKGSLWFSIVDYDSPEIYYTFSSYFYPSSIYRMDVNTREKELIYRRPVDFDVNEYTQEFVFYESKDGIRVPMYILHKKEFKLDGSHPALLTGYGGFGLGISPYFAEGYIPWLKRGGVVAIAGIRGGNEYGEEWHKEGMRDKKQNVFDDFIAAAEYLISKGYTNPEKLAISGGSNGGLLVGAVLTQRPDLFRAVFCAVPLLDMLRYHKFGVAHIWIPEYGNPDNPEDFKYLFAYSPYHHVEPDKVYPSVFFYTAESDGRVHPMHAMKMAAKMQNMVKTKGPILLYVEPKAGHGAGKPLKKSIQTITDQYIYLMWQLGMVGDEKS